MSDYRVDAATKEEWAYRALKAEARLAKMVFALRNLERQVGDIIHEASK